MADAALLHVLMSEYIQQIRIRSSSVLASNEVIKHRRQKLEHALGKQPVPENESKTQTEETTTSLEDHAGGNPCDLKLQGSLGMILKVQASKGQKN